MTAVALDLPLPLAAPVRSRHFLRLDFTEWNEAVLLRDIRERAGGATFSYIVTPNTAHVVKLDELDDTEIGRELREAYAAADIVLCDSRVLASLARLSGVRLKVMTGSDLTRMLFESKVIAAGDRVALVGGTPRQLDWLRRRWPEIEFSQHIPPMGVFANVQAQDEIVAFVEETGANFNLFTFGAPQSELVAWRVAERAKARGICLCVGASIEFLSGTKRRAPRWMQHLAIEWVFRLATEPRRLWRRYIVDAPRILPIWWRYRTAGAQFDRPKTERRRRDP